PLLQVKALRCLDWPKVEVCGEACACGCDSYAVVLLVFVDAPHAEDAPVGEKEVSASAAYAPGTGRTVECRGWLHDHAVLHSGSSSSSQKFSSNGWIAR